MWGGLHPVLICVFGPDCRNWNWASPATLPPLDLLAFDPIVSGTGIGERQIEKKRQWARLWKQANRMSSMEMIREARGVADSQSEMTEIILPNDANTLGNLLGGRLMHFIDLTGAMAAYRHSRTHVVTAAMDHIDFIQPVHVGDLLILKSRVNRAFSTSMEVGVKVWVEHPQTGVLLHVASAYLVFVAIDREGRRVQVPPLQPVNADEQRRYEGALRRREYREAEAQRRKQAKREYAPQKEAEKAKLQSN
jgi:acyl-CoA hydrolase